MNKIKIVFTSIFYPMFLGRYFLNALERRDDVELWTAGVFTGTWIPWANGMNLPQKYVYTPNQVFPRESTAYHIPPAMTTPPWQPDLWLHVDAGWGWNKRPNAKITARIQTDPHVLKQHYNASRYYDFEFCMQTPYMQPNEIFLPYAYDPTIHYPTEDEKEYDGCIIGLQYEKRTMLVNRLRARGYNLLYDIGIVYDENRVAYNKSRVAISWSSLLDLPARVWEGMGMALPVLTNRLPDLNKFFVEGEHYLGFETVQEAEEKFIWAIENYEKAKEIGEKAHQLVSSEHTYDARIQFLLEKVGLV